MYREAGHVKGSGDWHLRPLGGKAKGCFNAIDNEAGVDEMLARKVRSFLVGGVVAFVAASFIAGPANAEPEMSGEVIQADSISIDSNLELPSSVSLRSARSGALEVLEQRGYEEPYIPEVGETLTVKYRNATVEVVRPQAACSVSAAAITPTRAAKGYADAGARLSVSSGCKGEFQATAALGYKNLGGGYPNIEKNSTPIYPGVTKNVYVMRSCKSTKTHSWRSEALVTAKPSSSNDGWHSAEAQSPKVNLSCSI